MMPLDLIKIALIVIVVNALTLTQITSGNNVKIANVILSVSLNVSLELSIASTVRELTRRSDAKDRSYKLAFLIMTKFEVYNLMAFGCQLLYFVYQKYYVLLMEEASWLGGKVKLPNFPTSELCSS